MMSFERIIAFFVQSCFKMRLWSKVCSPWLVFLAYLQRAFTLSHLFCFNISCFIACLLFHATHFSLLAVRGSMKSLPVQMVTFPGGMHNLVLPPQSKSRASSVSMSTLMPPAGQAKSRASSIATLLPGKSRQGSIYTLVTGDMKKTRARSTSTLTPISSHWKFKASSVLALARSRSRSSVASSRNSSISVATEPEHYPCAHRDEVPAEPCITLTPPTVHKATVVLTPPVIPKLRARSIDTSQVTLSPPVAQKSRARSVDNTQYNLTPPSHSKSGASSISTLSSSPSTQSKSRASSIFTLSPPSQSRNNSISLLLPSLLKKTTSSSLGIGNHQLS